MVGECELKGPYGHQNFANTEKDSLIRYPPFFSLPSFPFSFSFFFFYAFFIFFFLLFSSFLFFLLCLAVINHSCYL